MIIIVALSLSLLVVLAALALLAKTKKEDLPKGYVFASYAVLSLGVLMFLGSIMGGVMRTCQKRGHDSCYSSQQGEKCGHMSTCSKAGMSCAHMGMNHGQQGMCGSSCTKGGHHAKCDGMHEGMMHKKMCIKKGGITKDVEIRMEIDDDEVGEESEE